MNPILFKEWENLVIAGAEYLTENKELLLMLYDGEDKLTKQGERRVGYDNVRGFEDFYTFR